MLPSFLGICATPTGGGGCPAYGTVLFNQNEFYPVSEGGLSFTYLGNIYLGKTCDVNYIADGTCGQTIDWSSVSNVAFVSNGYVYESFPLSLISSEEYSDNVSLADTSGPSWTIFGNTYYKQRFTLNSLTADGSGGGTGIYNTPDYWSTYYSLTLVRDYAPYEIEVPSGSSNLFNDGRFDRYHIDPMDPDNYNVTLSGTYHPYGTFITNDGTYDYYWDGSGGYYI